MTHEELLSRLLLERQQPMPRWDIHRKPEPAPDPDAGKRLAELKRERKAS